jgi:hypothetical protein
MASLERMVPVIAIVWSHSLVAAHANTPQQIVKSCSGAVVRSIELAADTTSGVSPDALSTEARLLSPQIPATTAPSETVEKAITVIAIGPDLSSMDSRKVEADLACTKKGLMLTATITHSDEALGYFLQ